eukprot:7746771-Heterocapsa_arctica.AAC.1
MAVVVVVVVVVGAVSALPTVCDGAFVGNELRRGKFKWLRGIAAADTVLPGPTAAIYGTPDD